MRVISGQARGRRLKAPKGNTTRPTSDRVKEAIFNVLAFKLDGSRILDVFAGTGGLGIEALSRGAQEAVFIEKNRAPWLILKENLLSTGLSSKGRLILGDFAVVLPQLEGRFDIAFLDPPYNRGFIQPAVSLIIQSGLLDAQGVIVVETNAREKELPDPGVISLVKESVYGDTAVLYYQFSEGVF
ncbi:16S rRNA (guanine(966)-N(2))-methyltransferase RsmD [Candidatus Formimonas warabiya]|uniref:16S rRNA (Guanine(966)-N(2))-methyltransferase RsmD n=1 Tax=Formimonas warabiya TaxID=1761012 RepID=A0A3G1KQE5_FORW1|nr:16S rRNA (guanine(966)-N(2))-methyltransferase RsmD [Candidatus Formimonas warabiya]